MENSIKPVAATTSNAPAIIKPDQQLTMVKIWGEDFDRLTKTQNFNITPEQRSFGISIITGLVDKCVKDKIDTKELNMTNFLEQVKHFGRMELSLQEQDVYLDVRNNKSTGMKDVTIRKQYQGIQKLMIKFSSKKILRFADGIVCEGDRFENKFDFSTGLNKIIYEPNPNVDHNDLKKITNAFAIAYVEELGTIIPYVVVINKQRIMRAYNASPSYDKGVWNTDTGRMVRKTAYWCLYNDVFKPFLNFKTGEEQESFAATEDDMDFSAQTEVTDDAVFEMPVEETNDFYAEVVEPAQDDFNAYLDQQEQTDELECANCGKKITEKVAKYSQDKFGRPLCFDCQHENQ